MKKIVIPVLIAVILFSTCVPALAENWAPAEIFADVIVARPLGLAALVAGSALFVVSLLWAVPSGSVEPVARALVTAPFNFTFTRPVGDFSVLE
jgi:hypothetical protein